MIVTKPKIFRRKVISSVAALLELLKNTPGLKDIPAMAPLKDALAKYTGGKSGCGSCQKNALLRNYRSTYEILFKGIPPAEQKQMKERLGVDEVCYYVTGQGGVFELKCF
jgi:hypothetical protein